MPESAKDISIVFDVSMMDFYREIAQRVGVHDDDARFIFGITSGQPTVLERKPTRIKFRLHDKYNTSFECTMGGNAMMLSAESQRNKTTSLLCIATLLGYPWDERDSVRFLGDEEFVKKGQMLRRSLNREREAHLEIARVNHRLIVETKGGKVSVTYRTANESDKREFELRRGWTTFERYMNRLVDVQLVSKGRNFIERVESDILDELKALGEALRENSQRALQSLTLRTTRQPKQRRSAAQLNRQALIQRIDVIQTDLRQKDSDRNRYIAQRALIQSIRADLRELGDEHRTIETIYRLECRLRAAEDAEREKRAYQDNLRRQKQEVEDFERHLKELQAQKDAIDNAFTRLRDDITTLYEKRRIAALPDALLASIDASDVHGACSAYYARLGTDSIRVYRALIRAIEDNASRDIALLPLGDIQDVANLVERLRSDLGRAESLVVINEAIERFKERLEKAGIDLGMTPDEYLSLERDIAQYAGELTQAQAELSALLEGQPVTEEEDADSLRKQIKEAEKRLTKQAREIREKIEETVRNLDAPDTYLNRIWSPDPMSYLQQQERHADEIVHRLRGEQHRLEQQKQQLEEELTKTEVRPTDDTTERVEHISEFIQTVSYVMEVANAKTDDERASSDVQNSLKALDEMGWGDLLKATIDNLITKRCKYYYDNSGKSCKPIPLEAIVYEQNNRDTPKFTVSGTHLDRSTLSGGTESVMTVRSLASRPSSKPFGIVLLVDEWGDVEQIGEPLFAELKQMDNIFASIFVKVEDIPELTAKAVN